MKQRLRNRILFNLLLLSYLLFTYYALGGWWNSAVGFVLILLFARLLWKREFLNRIGLAITLRTFMASVIVAVFTVVLSWLLISFIAGENEITVATSSWRDYFHDIFYILNEEIVLGAVILFYLARTRKMKPLLSCILLAVLFALVHFVFYKWIFNDRGTITLLTLTTLFMIGFFRNSLILATGHIGYSWAFHFGWMAVMFGSMHVYSASGERVTELDRFNFYLGSFIMLLLSSGLAISGMIILRKRRASSVERRASGIREST